MRVAIADSGICCVCVTVVISLCGRTYQTETAMWGDMFYSATITLVPPVTLVLHGLLPLHPLHSIHIASQCTASRFFWANSVDPNLPNKPYIYQNNKLSTVSFTTKNVKAFHYYPFTQQ